MSEYKCADNSLRIYRYYESKSNIPTKGDYDPVYIATLHPLERLMFIRGGNLYNEAGSIIPPYPDIVSDGMASGKMKYKPFIYNFYRYLRDIDSNEDTKGEQIVYFFGEANKIELSLHQKRLFNVISDMNEKSLTKEGIILWHNVGSGKTCASISIADSWRKRGWKVKWVTKPSLKNLHYSNITDKSCILFSKLDRFVGKNAGDPPRNSVDKLKEDLIYYNDIKSLISAAYSYCDLEVVRKIKQVVASKTPDYLYSIAKKELKDSVDVISGSIGISKYTPQLVTFKIWEIFLFSFIEPYFAIEKLSNSIMAVARESDFYKKIETYARLAELNAIFTEFFDFDTLSDVLVAGSPLSDVLVEVSKIETWRNRRDALYNLRKIEKEKDVVNDKLRNIRENSKEVNRYLDDLMGASWGFLSNTDEYGSIKKDISDERERMYKSIRNELKDAPPTTDDFTGIIRESVLTNSMFKRLFNVVDRTSKMKDLVKDYISDGWIKPINYSQFVDEKTSEIEDETVIVIDEFHLPLLDESLRDNFTTRIRDIINSDKKTFFILLSATPMFRDYESIFTSVNLIANPMIVPSQNVQVDSINIGSYVSYVDLRENRSIFAAKNVSTETVEVEMTTEALKRQTDIFKGQLEGAGGEGEFEKFKNELEQFFIATNPKQTNATYGIPVEKGMGVNMTPRTFDSPGDFNLNSTMNPIENIGVGGILLALAEKIKKLDAEEMRETGNPIAKNKHFIFIDSESISQNSPQSIPISAFIANYLAKVLDLMPAIWYNDTKGRPGGELYNGCTYVNNAGTLTKSGYGYCVNTSREEYDHRRIAYASYKPYMTNQASTGGYRPMTDKFILNAIIKIFNTPGLYNGVRGALEDSKNIRFIILDKKLTEGVSLYGVKNVHILSEMDRVREIQAIGRAFRMCGHTPGTTVNVIQYKASLKYNDKSVSSRKLKGIKDESDVDRLLKYLKIHTLENQYENYTYTINRVREYMNREYQSENKYREVLRGLASEKRGVQSFYPFIHNNRKALIHFKNNITHIYTQRLNIEKDIIGNGTKTELNNFLTKTLELYSNVVGELISSFCIKTKCSQPAGKFGVSTEDVFRLLGGDSKGFFDDIIINKKLMNTQIKQIEDFILNIIITGRRTVDAYKKGISTFSNILQTSGYESVSEYGRKLIETAQVTKTAPTDEQINLFVENSIVYVLNIELQKDSRLSNLKLEYSKLSNIAKNPRSEYNESLLQFNSHVMNMITDQQLASSITDTSF